jgi:ABC-type multidrug transport system permease subunit
MLAVRRIEIETGANMNVREYMHITLLPWFDVLRCVEIPFTALASLCFMLPYYYLAGFLPDGVEFCKAFLLFYMIGLCTNALGHAMAAILPNLVVAVQIQGLFFTFIFTFGGVFIREKGAGGLTAGWNWIYWMNWLPKGLNAFALAQFGCDGGVGAGCPSLSNFGTEIAISDYLTQDYLGGWITSGYYAQQVS